MVDKSPQIYLHTASVVLKKLDHSLSLYQYGSYMLCTTPVLAGEQASQPRECSHCAP